MAQPHQKSIISSSQTRNTPASRGRRSPQNRSDRTGLTKGLRHGRAKFLHYFPTGFRDPLYEDWERGYKWAAHERWTETLDQASFRKLLRAGKHHEVAAQAVAIEARTNLLFSFEKMALRDGIKPSAGARAFAQGLYATRHSFRISFAAQLGNLCGVAAARTGRSTGPARSASARYDRHSVISVGSRLR